MNRRRLMLSLLALSAAGEASGASSPPGSRPWRIGTLNALGKTFAGPFSKEFRDVMSAAGPIKGQQFTYEDLVAEGRNERLPELAAELVRLDVDVIVAVTTNAAIAAMNATASIPIVFVSVADPVAAGFTNSLAKPSRNLTGMSNFAADLQPKRLDLLKHAFPKLSRVALLVNPENPYSRTFVPLTQSAATAVGVELVVVEWNGIGDIRSIFAKTERERVQALLVGGDVYHFERRLSIAEAALKQRIAVMTPFREFTEAGCLMSYGISLHEQNRQIVRYVRKILNGAKPQDVPIEQPTKLELVVNARTAKTLALTLPQELLMFAEDVIQ